jgi:hypothetical protein
MIGFPTLPPKNERLRFNLLIGWPLSNKSKKGPLTIGIVSDPSPLPLLISRAPDGPYGRAP